MVDLPSRLREATCL